MVQVLPDKQCLSDPLPTWLLKKSVNVLAPFLCRLFCWSRTEYKVRIHYVDFKEGRLGFVRSEIVSADFESLGTVQPA